MTGDGVYTAEDFIMDTTVRQQIYGEYAARACESASDLMRRIEDRMSFFRSGSDIRALNEAAGTGGPVPVCADTMTVLRAARDYAEQSDGAFDVTAAPLSVYWREAAAGGDGRPDSKLPDEEALRRVRRLVGSDGLRLFPEAGTAMLEKKHSAVDLGGIAKGFAADRVVELYRAMGIAAALVNLGGNVKTLGRKPDGQPWIIGLQDPDEARGVYFGLLRVGGTSVVTSGAYERFVKIAGERYHHIMDPRSGRPARAGLSSATVIAEDSMRADALSTAIFVLGRERAGRLLSAYPGTEAVLMDDSRRVWLSPGIRETWAPAPGYEDLPVHALEKG